MSKEIIIKQFSDIHFNKKFNLKILDRIYDNISTFKTDYVCITGDILDSALSLEKDENLKYSVLDWIKKMSLCSKIIVIFGNHDIVEKGKTFFYVTTDDDFWNELRGIDNIYILNNDYYEDDYVYIAGIFPPIEYYRNSSNSEDKSILIEQLKKEKDILTSLGDNKLKILLHHSPVYMCDEDILEFIGEFNLILSGHMHNGLVLPFLEHIYPKNKGLVGAYIKLFPKLARGIKNIDYKGKIIKLIITGGIMKIVLPDSILNKLNAFFPSVLEEIKYNTDTKDIQAKTIKLKR